MITNPTMIERAFELARSGEVADMAELRRRLKREKFDSIDAHFSSPMLSKQLVGLMQTAALSKAAAGG